MKKMAYRVVAKDGNFAPREEYPIRRNIFYTRGEAELYMAGIHLFNPRAELIIEESELMWKVSPER